MKKFILLHVALLLILNSASAQYFGKNKPRYRSFDFKIAETPHFRLHYYMDNPEMVSFVSRLSEQWYTNHKKIFGQDISQKVPIILYNNHPEFQQTNTISGDIGVGIGGVTEALKTRVVLPVSFSNQGTHHVLVHELVHAFQYDAILNGDSTSLQSLSNLPLWMIEGMAEYFSLGRMDPLTSMWMRDAILNDQLPEIKKLNDSRYFPYRYGHSLIAFLGGFYGDQYLRNLFVNSAKYGLEQGFVTTYGHDSKTISSLWHNAMKTFYAPLLEGNKEKPHGKKLLSDENAGMMNISPAISPNGRYIVFMSEKDLFTTELYLADATSGAIIRKITSLTGQGDLDYINGFESTGSWAPDNRTFSFVGVRKGKNVLVTIDALSGKSLHTVSIPGLDAFVSPVYHPSGKEIIVTGSKEGKTDLYSYHLKTKKVRQLTDDTYSELLSSFSPDGNSLVFMYDKASFSHQRADGRYTHDLAIMDYASSAIKTLSVFKNADHINPVYDHEGNILFVSDYDGLRNLYKYETATGNILQLTRLLTGISGITATSPMISASTKKDRLLYTLYFNGGYSIFSADAADWLNFDVSPQIPPARNWGLLPVQIPGRESPVQESFSRADEDLARTNPAIVPENYTPRFKLDYIGGGGGIGVGVNNNSFRNAAGLQGGVDMLFSDMLGNHQMYSQIALNGEILDLGGMVSYINRKNQLAWGVSLSHVPLRTGYQDFENVNIRIGDIETSALKASTNLIRIFDESVNLFAHFPFSTTLRLEGGIGTTYRSFRWDEYNDYYVGDPFAGYSLIAQDRKRVPTENELIIDRYYKVVKGFGANANIAFVGDNAFFGMTAPLAGHRFRLGVEQYFGNDKYTALLADARKYVWLKPVSLAFRATSYLRYEKEVNAVYPLFIGNMGFVRGLGSIVSTDVEALGLTFSQLIGSKIVVGGAELRIPFTGPKRLALIPSSYFLTDVNLFFDAGVAFDRFADWSSGKLIDVVVRDEGGNILLDPDGNPIYDIRLSKPTIVSSIGVSARINLFGAFIVEPYYAMPLVAGSRFRFGLNLIPGW